MYSKRESLVKAPRRDLLDPYVAFDQLSGFHPWMRAVPSGFVPYQVRELGVGEVSYFNFVLAKEMGLIDSHHPHRMTASLRKKIIDTFSIQIINEYDKIHGLKVDSNKIKPNFYMATRYLQLQHSNKRGETSGDGRGIWNGVISHQGIMWDVSSRGTGVTCLSPGAVEAQRPLKTGEGTYGYGCGQAEIDELYGAALMAELLHIQGHATERVLCIINYGNGYGIGVRAAPNLIRPAHLFLYLKQGRYTELRSALDYFIERQIANRRFTPTRSGLARYDDLLNQISKDFARFAAHLEVDYIFAWLDWDGDNVLADAGIIDYGSIRQFGARHDLYRYDDVTRFSTTLSEQRAKARQIVQIWAQCIEYVKTGNKKTQETFVKHKAVKLFDMAFDLEKTQRILYRVGFNKNERDHLLQKPSLVRSFLESYRDLEKIKVKRKIKKVADGVNRPPLFNLRNLLRVLPKYMKKGNLVISSKEVFEIAKTSFVSRQDQKKSSHLRKKVGRFVKSYEALVNHAIGSSQHLMSQFSERAYLLNNERRITGNALIHIVDEIINLEKKSNSTDVAQSMIDLLIMENLGCSEVELSSYYKKIPRLVVQPQVYQKLLSAIRAHQDDI